MVRKAAMQFQGPYLIAKMLDQYDNLPVECDGFTRIATYLLTKNKIPHKVFFGSCLCVEGLNYDIAPHYWIELEDGWTVDYRLAFYPLVDRQGMKWRMSGGRPVSELADAISLPPIPHGVFRQEDFPEFQYTGVEVPLEVTEMIFQILTTVGVDAKERVVLDELARKGFGEEP